MDKVLLAFLLLRIYLRCTGGDTFEQEFDYLLLHSSKLQIGISPTHNAPEISIPHLNNQQLHALQSLAKLPAFKVCIDELKGMPGEDLKKWLESDKPEFSVPMIWKSESICKYNIFFFIDNIH